ncbi:MAG TPA: CPBP family glutamic-type intramembrane protease [Rubrobacteraceae bacterium]|nr:CPBP family glutamic-type intramembrane protease [Rubrobacteraceae bacterium]
MRFFLEEEGGRPRALWRLLGQFAAFLAITAILSGPLTAVWLAAGSASLGDSVRSTGASPAVFFIGSLASLLAIFASLWLAGRFLDRRPFRDFGFHLSGGWLMDLFFGMFLGALLMTGIFLIEWSAGWVSVTGAFETVEPGAPFALAMLLPIGIFVCVGVYEEALSRGYQLRNIAEGLNYPAVNPRAAVVAAWVLSSSFFGLLHLFNPNASLLSTFNIALAGLLLGAGYVLTGELAIPIGLHITWNFFQGNVYGFPVSGLNPIGATFLTTEQSGPKIWTGGAFGPEAGLLDPAATLAGILLIMLWIRLRNGRAAIHTPLAEPPKPSKSVSEPSHPAG